MGKVKRSGATAPVATTRPSNHSHAKQRIPTKLRLCELRGPDGIADTSKDDTVRVQCKHSAV